MKSVTLPDVSSYQRWLQGQT